MSNTIDDRTNREWAAYIRVSTRRDREGERFASPDVQAKSVKHLNPVHTFDDIDRTGRNFDRPGITAAVAWVMESPETRGLAVYNLSRLGRNTAESLRLTTRLTRAGAGLFSAYETVDTETATGQINLRLFLSMAELQSDQISDTWRQVLSRRSPSRQRGRSRCSGRRERRAQRRPSSAPRRGST